MSLFNDYFKSFDIKSIGEEICVSMIIGKGVSISGSVRVIDVSDKVIVLKCKSKYYNVIGNCLIIKSLAKGEVFIEGEVYGFLRCDYEK